MSTVTSIVIENQSQSDPKSTWTIVASGDDYSITTTGQTITIASPPYMIAQYIGSRKNRCSVWINGWLSMTSPTYTERQITQFLKNLDDSAISSGTVFTLPDNSQSFPYTIDGNTIFTSSNPTTKNVPIYVSATLMHAYSWNSNGEVFNGYEGYLAFSPNHTIGTVYYSCPPALSTCSISKNTSAGYYVGLTTVTVSVPITYSASGTTGTAKYGGYIKKIDVTIGGQTVTKTFTESTKPTNTQTFSIQLANAGTFTPTITVTDSRDQTATQELSQITVNAYDVPSISFDVFRTNSSGVKSDEGTYGLIVADITYTDAIATITEPSVTIDGTATSNVTWYSSYSSSTGVSSTISNWASLTPTDHSVTVYGLVNESFNIGQSYVIGMSDEDSLGGQSQTVSQTLSTAFYTIDFQAGGKEIAFGAPANDTLTQEQEQVGLFKCAMETSFETDVVAESPYYNIDTSASAGTVDGDLYRALNGLGWTNIISSGKFAVKRLLTEILNRLDYTSVFTVSYHESEAITTGAYTNRETSQTCTKSGYYPLGIVGYYPVWVSGQTALINFYLMELSSRSSGSATVYYGLQNTGGSSVSYKLRWYILWVKE